MCFDCFSWGYQKSRQGESTVSRETRLVCSFTQTYTSLPFTSTSHICLASPPSLIFQKNRLFVRISRRTSTMSIFTKGLSWVVWSRLKLSKINVSVLTISQLKATLYLDYQLLKDVTFIKRGPDEDIPEFKSLVYKYLYIILAISAMSILYGCFYRHKCGRD